jgi:hypothetical protein
MKDEKPDIQALEREFQRVGITWEAFRELDRLNQAPNMPPSPDGSFAMQMNLPAILTLLRSLPNNAGQPAFLEAFRVRFAEPAIARARVAERKFRSQEPGGSAGA